MRAKQFVAGAILIGLAAFGGISYYSWVWSERFLAPVRVGMSKGQVQTLIGSARRIRSSGGTETWDYTRLWSRDARVYFGTNGAVCAIEAD